MVLDLVHHLAQSEVVIAEIGTHVVDVNDRGIAPADDLIPEFLAIGEDVDGQRPVFIQLGL